MKKRQCHSFTIDLYLADTLGFRFCVQLIQNAVNGDGSILLHFGLRIP